MHKCIKVNTHLKRSKSSYNPPNPRKSLRRHKLIFKKAVNIPIRKNTNRLAVRCLHFTLDMINIDKQLIPSFWSHKIA